MYSVTTAIKGTWGTPVNKTRHYFYTSEAYSSENKIKIEEIILLNKKEISEQSKRQIKKIISFKMATKG